MRSELKRVILVTYTSGSGWKRWRFEEKVLDVFANLESNCSTVDRNQYLGHNI